LSRWILRGLAGVAVLLLLSAVGFFGVVGWRWWRFRSETCRVTPLMFHAIRSDSMPRARYWLRTGDFAREMSELRAAGAVTPPLDSVADWLNHPERACPFPRNAVIITFDLDGISRHVDFALPELLRNGFRAVFFVPLAALDHPPGVTTPGLVELARAGMTIGSHTEHHYDMRYEQPDSMVASLLRTRERLGAITGQPIATVSAPGGRYNDRVVAGVGRAGFSTFFTSDPCYITPKTPALTLCRIEIRGDGGMTALDALEHPWGVALQSTMWSLKRRVEALIGPRLWFLVHSMRKEIEGPGY
jgi:peptidoglycan/xylan/chitin deacetylase (PgdA/CDA1 family)